MKRGIFFLLGLFIVGVPLEHKYDKLFRFYSLKLIPQGLYLPKEFDPKIYFYLSDLVSIFLFCAVLFVLRIPLREMLWKRGMPFLWFFFGCAFFSIITSPMHAYPVAYVRLFQLLSPLLLCGVIGALKEPEKATKVMLGALLGIGIFEALVGIVQYFHQGPLGLRLLGEVSHFDAFFSIPGGSRWLLDDFSQTVRSPTVWRAVGTLPHANVFGGVMALSLLASYPFLKNRWVQLLFPLQFFALCLSFSRSALFGWAIGTALWLWFAHKDKKVVKIVLFSLLLSFSLLSRQIFFRGGVISEAEISKASNAERLELQANAFALVKEKPWTGVGFQQYSYAASTKDRYIPAPHNIYLYVASEIGLLGLAAFLSFLAVVGHAFWKAPKSPLVLSLGSIFVFFLFVGLCDFYPILFQQGKMLFFPLAGLLLSFEKKSLVTKTA